MTNPAPHANPCARCHQPHPARIAGDGQRTYRHVDGHPYQPAEQVEFITTGLPAGWEPALFGALAKCPHCRALVDNNPHTGDIAAHTRYHEE